MSQENIDVGEERVRGHRSLVLGGTPRWRGGLLGATGDVAGRHGRSKYQTLLVLQASSRRNPLFSSALRTPHSLRLPRISGWTSQRTLSNPRSEAPRQKSYSPPSMSTMRKFGPRA